MPCLQAGGITRYHTLVGSHGRRPPKVGVDPGEGVERNLLAVDANDGVAVATIAAVAESPDRDVTAARPLMVVKVALRDLVDAPCTPTPLV